ncbi:MAG: hypothetical protein H5T86_01065 [Armatimonadetes bacterium]|nr:hypothetical protein [Armatimonadota bacterium]
MRRGAVAAPVLAASGIVALLYSIGAFLDEPRKTFVALRYFQEAQRKLQRRPVDRRGAAADIRRSLEVAPREIVILRHAADTLLAAEAYADALDVFAKQPPSTLAQQISYGHCLIMTDRIDEGEAVILRAISLAGVAKRRGEMPAAEYALLANNAAYALSLAGVSLEQARILAESAVAYAPLEPAFCDTLGWILFRLGQTVDAAFYLERAVRWEMRNPDPVVLYHLGAVYASMHRVEAARRLLVQSILLDPARDDARWQLRQLYRVLPEPAYVTAPVALQEAAAVM